jgi:hypothetical protein
MALQEIVWIKRDIFKETEAAKMGTVPPKCINMINTVLSDHAC